MTTSTLMQANRQWATRPEDERFTSLTSLHAHTLAARDASTAYGVSTRSVHAAPIEGDSDALAVVVDGMPLAPTHWAFSQLAQRAGAPAGYLRSLPAPLAADCVNYGLTMRDADDLGILYRAQGGTRSLAAVTGPAYGRVWNSDIAGSLVRRFGDGVTGDFRVPGEFGKEVAITKANTTLFASDRDMFIFLADERNRIEIPNRRAGRMGSFARGFFLWNSEVGAQTFGVGMFLFDYVCCNRIVWGAEGYKEIRIRHTSSAPHRWIDEVAPTIARYAESASAPVVERLALAQASKLTKVDEFLANRFSRPQVAAIKAAHLADEGRPIETVWDAVTGATAYARDLPHQDSRVEVERAAGKLLDLVK